MATMSTRSQPARVLSQASRPRWTSQGGRAEMRLRSLGVASPQAFHGVISIRSQNRGRNPSAWQEGCCSPPSAGSSVPLLTRVSSGSCRLQKKTVWRHGAFDPQLLHRDSQIRTNCGRARREILWCDISPWKPAWRKAGSGSGGSKASVNHLKSGLSTPEREHGLLFLLNSSVLHLSLPQ